MPNPKRGQNNTGYFETLVYAMFSKISLDVVDAFLNCRFKAYLRLARQQGVKSEFANSASSAMPGRCRKTT